MLGQSTSRGLTAVTAFHMAGQTAQRKQSKKPYDDVHSYEWVACGRGGCTHWQWLEKMDTCVCEKCHRRWPKAVLEAAWNKGGKVSGFWPDNPRTVQADREGQQGQQGEIK